MRCKAKTSKGSRCRRSARPGSERCHAHEGKDVGRRHKLTPELQRRLVEAMRTGVSKEVAAEYAGISRSTLYRWLSLAEVDVRCRELRQELKRAEAEAEVHAAALLRRAMPDNWQAAVAFLERRHRGRWSKHAPAPALEMKDGTRADPDIDVTDPETRRMLSEILRRSTDPR